MAREAGCYAVCDVTKTFLTETDGNRVGGLEIVKAVVRKWVDLGWMTKSDPEYKVIGEWAKERQERIQRAQEASKRIAEREERARAMCAGVR